MKRSEIAHLLRGIVQRTLAQENPLDAMLGAMESLHAPAEAILDQIDSMCNPHRASDAFGPFLAHWVDLERIFAPREEGDNLVSTGLGRLRELIRIAPYLSKWRGTKQGLRRYMETSTRVTTITIPHHESARLYHRT